MKAREEKNNEGRAECERLKAVQERANAFPSLSSSQTFFLQSTKKRKASAELRFLFVKKKRSTPTKRMKQQLSRGFFSLIPFAKHSVWMPALQ